MPVRPAAPTCHVELSEGVACGRAHSREEVGRLVCKVVAVAEVKAGEQGHVADDQPQRGVSDVQASKPEINHVAEFAAIVLTCRGRGKAGIRHTVLHRADPVTPPALCLAQSSWPRGSGLLGLSVGGVSKSRI